MAAAGSVDRPVRAAAPQRSLAGPEVATRRSAGTCRACQDERCALRRSALAALRSLPKLSPPDTRASSTALLRRSRPSSRRLSLASAYNVLAWPEAWRSKVLRQARQHSLSGRAHGLAFGTGSTPAWPRLRMQDRLTTGSWLNGCLSPPALQSLCFRADFQLYFIL